MIKVRIYRISEQINFLNQQVGAVCKIYNMHKKQLGKHYKEIDLWFASSKTWYHFGKVVDHLALISGNGNAKTVKWNMTEILMQLLMSRTDAIKGRRALCLV